MVADVEPIGETATTSTAKSSLSSDHGSFDQASSLDDDNSVVSLPKYQNKPSVVCDNSDDSGAVSLSRCQKIPADDEVVSEDGECVRSHCKNRRVLSTLICPNTHTKTFSVCV